MSLDLLDQRRTWLLHLEANLTNRFPATETEAAARWAWCYRRKTNTELRRIHCSKERCHDAWRSWLQTYPRDMEDDHVQQLKKAMRIVA